MKLTALLVLLLADSLTVNALTCPYTWSAYYGICIRYAGTTNFYSAISRCKQFGGRLVEPRNEIMSKYIARLIPSGKLAWLGIKDNRYVSDGKLITFKRPYYYAYIAYIRSTGYWGSTTSTTASLRAYCELPSTNTDCPELGTLFLEDSFPVSSSTNCKTACANSDGCEFWTYGSKQCGLRFYKPGDVVGGVVSSSRTGFPTYEIPQSGRVLVGKAVKNVGNAAECQKLCSEDPKCNSFTWTNYDYIFRINTRTCVFNYGKTLRKLALPADYRGYQIVSGPACCDAKSACQTRDDNLNINFQAQQGSNRGEQTDSEEPLTPEQIEEYQKELEQTIRNVSSNSTTTEGPRNQPFKVEAE